MKHFVYLFLLLVSVSGHAFDIPFDFSVPPQSYAKKITSCYRWMQEGEAKKWQTKPYLQPWYSDLLGRGSDRMTTFCWANPVGATMGSYNEDYGDHLVRIDFVDDAVFYDRNKNEYFSLDASNIISADHRQGMDTEIVYNMFYGKNLPWFQEYLLRSTAVIKSWTFNDQKLRELFAADLARFEAFQFDFSEIHFFFHFFSHSRPFFEETGRPYYLSELKRKEKLLRAFWNANPQDQLLINPEARASIPTVRQK